MQLYSTQCLTLACEEVAQVHAVAQVPAHKHAHCRAGQGRGGRAERLVSMAELLSCGCGCGCSCSCAVPPAAGPQTDSRSSWVPPHEAAR